PGMGGGEIVDPGGSGALAEWGAAAHPSLRSPWSRVRQLRGPQVSTCAWWSKGSGKGGGAAGQHVRVVEQAIEEGGDGRGVAEQFPPVLDGTVRGDERRRSFVAAHDGFTARSAPALRH